MLQIYCSSVYERYSSNNSYHTVGAFNHCIQGTYTKGLHSYVLAGAYPLWVFTLALELSLGPEP